MGRICKLVVEVVSANILVGDGLAFVNPRVKLTFDTKSCVTSVKGNTRQPVWNESFCFSVPNKAMVRSLYLEACVHNVNDPTNSESLLGMVRIAGSSLLATSSNAAAAMGHPLKSGRSILFARRSKGVLVLRVFLQDSENAQALEGSQAKGIAPTLPPTTIDDSHHVKEIEPKFEEGKLVEHMPYLYVHVVKARDLPDVDATGSLDPFVEVRAGTRKAATKHLEKEQNPEWNVTFAFCMRRIQMCRVHVIVKDKDKVRDDFVGKLEFNQKDIPERLRADDPPVRPMWHQLLDKNGAATDGELMVAIWKGLLADEAYPDAWDSVSFDMDASVLPHIRPKVYDTPTLWYVRLFIHDFHDTATPDDYDDLSKDLYVSTSLGSGQLRETQTVRKKHGDNYYTWKKEALFVAAEPFESDLRICVKERIGPDQEKVIGQTTIALASLEKRVHDHLTELESFALAKGPAGADNGSEEDDDLGQLQSGTIRLRICLDGGYQVLHNSDDSDHFVDDTRPEAHTSHNSPIGSLELGILRAEALRAIKTRHGGKPTTDAFCVAKYGAKWVRTRTVVNTGNPVFNEQYNWEVFDTATVLTIGVFDNGQIQDGDQQSSSIINKDTRIGMVRIRLSLLQPGKVHAHAYPLLLLTPAGPKKMGEVHLAVRFSMKTWTVKLLCLYARSILPEKHYRWPIAEQDRSRLRHEAVRIVSARMGQVDPPLSKEVVEYMCDSVSHWLYSFRRCRAYYFRLMAVMSWATSLYAWFGHVCSWRNPAATVLIHAAFLLALIYEVILPCLLLLVLFAVAWNCWQRPRSPPHHDVVLSRADSANPDELDEEFDTFPTSRRPDVVRFRYDKLRSVAGRIMMAMSDFISQAERIQALFTWRDPTATAIVLVCALAAASLVCVVPCKIIAAIAWCYIMRAPILRQRMGPSPFVNFFRRLPSKEDMMI
ncbi:unnamed protein product [Urochloa humidicola]